MQSSRISRLPRLLAVLALALSAACGGDGPSGPDPNPTPAVTAVTPATVVAGSAQATVTVTGSRFIAESKVRFNGAQRPTEFVSATELRATLSAADLAGAGAAQLSVVSPEPGGGVSNTTELVVVNPAPSLASVAPGALAAGSAGATVTLGGLGFVAQSEVRVGGVARPTTFVSATQVRVALTAADLATAGPVQLTVFNPAPGGGLSSAAQVMVANLLPAITSITPGFVATGSPGATITVTGTGFVQQSQVITGAAQRQTAFVSATELRVTLTEAEVAAAGTLELRVQNPAPGGGISNAAPLELRAPVPVITSLDPAHTPDRQGTLELRVNGTGFAANSEVRVVGSPRPTRATGTTQLVATLNAADLQEARSFSVTVTTPGPAGGTSNAVLFEVRAPAPVITSLGETQTLVGQTDYTLVVNGTGFRSGSQVRVNGIGRPTQVVSDTRLEATLIGSDLQRTGMLQVTVLTPGPGGGTSAAVPLQVLNPAPRISSLPSRGASAGRQGFTLVVHGSGFVRESTVRWNGAERPTTFISESRLAASITSGDVASPGTAQVTVGTPAPGGGTSLAVAVQIRAVPAATVTSEREVAIAARDLVWSAATGRLYASVPASVPTYGNSVVAIDPATGNVTGSVFVGSEPGAMAVSGSGDVLYVALTGSGSIRRVALATLTAGLEFPVGDGAEEIAVMPGRPGTVAVSLQDTRISPRHKGVCIYDDGVRRARCTQGHTGSNSIEFGEDGSVLYGYNNETTEFGFRTLSVSADGLRETRVSDGLVGGFGVRIHYASGRVYAHDGAVLDAARHVRVGTIGGGWPVPDPALGRVFVLNGSGNVDVYDMNHLTSIGSISLGSFGVGLVRWGSDGLAYRDGDGIHIVRAPLAAP